MPKTLLQIVNDAQAELGLPKSSTVVNNPDPTTTQMFSLANRCLDEMRKMAQWADCQFEYIITVRTPIVTTGTISSGSLNVVTGIASTAGIVPPYWTISGNSVPQAARVQSVDSISQVTMNMQAGAASTNQSIIFSQDTYPIPPDFDYLNNRTMWDRTNRWELLGPDSPQMDQWHRSGIVATGPRRHFRKLGPFANSFRIWPPPSEIASPLQLVFEYLSLNAIMVHGSNTTFAQYFANDDDQPFLSDAAVTTGLKWMFWRAKGFNYVDMKNEWVDYVDREAARDKGNPTLSLVKRVHPIFISPANVQDGFFPGPVGPNMA